ncbi:MAG: ribosome biogenesis GTP-binding protein YihA/YsxC [Acutalibacteraceae bacterium]|nr:ribosome biogenesis GTP-binding protein YihA/YsxC [Acutalibacteraceae bacterium]
MKIESAVFESSFGNSNQLPISDLPEIAFSGKSNVGKSSLLNKLLNRKQLARVSSSPGKTTTINFFKLDDCRFVDLPGYGYAKVSQSEKIRWSELMEGYFNSNRNLSLIVQLIDIRHKPSDDDYSMLDYLKQTGYEFVIVLTKADKLKTNELNKRLSELEQELKDYKAQKIVFSSLKGTGREELLNCIKQKI